MEPSTAAIVAAAAANAVVLLGGFALWLAHRTRRAERLEQRERERAQLYLGPVEARLAELARGMDAIAVEVERVAEAQRYLVARGQPAVAPQPLTAPAPTVSAPRTVTPH